MKNFMKYDFCIDTIIIACYVKSVKGSTVHNNRPTHGLAFHPSGDRYYIFDNGKNVRALRGDIVYLPKNSNYVVKCSEPGDCYAINFDISEAVDFPPFSFKVKNRTAFLEQFKQAESAWRTKRTGYQMRCKSELYGIILRLINEYALGYADKSKTDLLGPAIDHIHRKYTEENINIAELAELCNISETYFRRIFKRAYGIPPLKYINDLKISRAKELLSSDMYTVTEIAELSGFHDEAYFSREFKKATGVPPSEF